MAYDPIIHFYDDPGHPYWPNKDSGSGGGGSERVELFNETVTTVAGEYGNTATLTYTGDIGGSTLTVTFDGVEYVLPKTEYGYGAPYGTDGFDFSTYPLSIELNPDTNSWNVLTEDTGEHTIVAYQTTITLGSMQLIGLYSNHNGGSVHVATTPFDVSGDNEGEMLMALDNNADIVRLNISSDDGATAAVPGGSYIVMNVNSTSSAPINGLRLIVDDEPVTDGYEVKQFGSAFYLTTRVPQGPAQHTLIITTVTDEPG